MKPLLATLVATLILMSCQTDSEKADKLRLENKFEEAAELYQKAVDEGDAYAMWRLSNAYANGDGVDWDEKKALELLKRAAENGCEEAKCDLAFAYMFDWYKIGEDTNKGKKMLDDLVKNTTNSTVLSRYAGLLFSGKGPYEEDKEKAMRILDKIEDKKNPYYLEEMGFVYFDGTDKIEISVEKALEYFSKAFENGRRNCASGILWIYTIGYGDVKKDIAKQIEWLNRGIESNVTYCMVQMALVCTSEDSAYQDMHNPQRAVELLKRAAKRGSGEAYFNLGSWYHVGKWLPKDDEMAFKNWEKGAELNNAEAMSNLAWAYMNGIGCEKDEKKAVELHKKAAENGSGYSAKNLYLCYWNGICGVAKDKEQAKKYLLRAAELNDEYGCYILGCHYYQGSDIIDKHAGQAFVYIKKAADMGHIDACSLLAYFYENGIACDKNPQKAKEYKDKTVVNSDKKEQ